MLIFIKVLIIVYLLAINVYSFLLVITQKNASENYEKNGVSDGKIFVAGLLGGATAVYVAMFILKYRLQNLFLMVIMPVLIAINAYVVFLCFTSTFGLVANTPYGISLVKLIVCKHIFKI